MSEDTDLEPRDFHIVVKRREHSQLPWRWEVWAAGKTKATEQPSPEHYATMSEAMKAGKSTSILARQNFPSAAEAGLTGQRMTGSSPLRHPASCRQLPC
jgi:hypothetical protein